MGEYTKGLRKGSECVAKAFKERSVFESSYFDSEIQVVNKTIEIVDTFNALGIADGMIWVNRPTVWSEFHTLEKCLVEPFIRNFEKLNSNTGWTPYHTNKWVEIMQALSHFSYHMSGGQLLLCDLQGGATKLNRGFIITDPVIMSNERLYGASDLGAQGISTFFARHTCTQYCHSYWPRPRDTRTYFKQQRGSSMLLHNNLNLRLSHCLPNFPQRQTFLPPMPEEDFSDSDY